MTTTNLKDVGVALIDDNNPDLGLRLTFTGGNMCNATNFYTLTV